MKDEFEELKRSIDPDVIFTHYRQDAHQDHRLVGELTWNTWRDHYILEYEIPKFDGDLGSPSVFVDAAEAAPQPRSCASSTTATARSAPALVHDDTFLGLMRLRGIEGNTPSGYAEAFYCRKAPLAF